MGRKLGDDGAQVGQGVHLVLAVVVVAGNGDATRARQRGELRHALHRACRRGLFAREQGIELGVGGFVAARKVGAVGGHVLELPLPRAVVHEGQQVRMAVVQQIGQHGRRGLVGDFVAGVHPVVHQRMGLPGVDRAGNLGGKTVVAHAQFMVGEGQGVKHRGDAGHRIALVGLGAGEVQRKVDARARLDFFFQRIAMQVDHAGDQHAPGQIQRAGVADGFGVDRRNDAVVDQDGHVVTHLLGENDAGVGQQ